MFLEISACSHYSHDLADRKSKHITSVKKHSQNGSKMDLPVLQIETNLIEFRHANRTCQDYVYIYIYVFLLIFGIYIYTVYTPQKRQIEMTVKNG